MYLRPWLGNWPRFFIFHQYLCNMPHFLVISLKWLLYLVAFLALALVGFLVFLRVYFDDARAQPVGTLVPEGAPKRVLLVFPHPDDEVTSIATILQEKANGATVGLLYLTRGEAGRTGGLVEKAQLGQARTRETQAVAQLLGADHLRMCDFPDSGIERTAPDSIKQVILEEIRQFQPSTVITHDDRVGLYGHPDHRLTARYVFELCQQYADSAAFPVQVVYGVTLSEGMINTALQISKGFQKSYPKEPGKGLPAPEVCVVVTPYGQQKLDAAKAHQTQWESLGDLMPLHDKLPTWLYFRIFAKEYFYLAWER